MSGANSRPGGGVASFQTSKVRCPSPDRIDLRPISGFQPRGSQETRSTVLHRLADDHRTPRDGCRTGLRRPRLCVSRVRPRPGPGVDRHGRGGSGGHQPGPFRARGHLGLGSCSSGAVGHGGCRAGFRSYRPGGRGRRRPLLHRSGRSLGRRPGSGSRGLAGPSRRGLLPGHRSSTYGPRTAPASGQPRPGRGGHRGRIVRRPGEVPGRRRKPPEGRGSPDRRPRDSPHRSAGRHHRDDPS